MVLPDSFSTDSLRHESFLTSQTPSNGKFGFSVQKQICLDCGGIADGEHYGEAFQKFDNTVQWRRGGERGVVNPVYDASAPPGHLPLGMWGVHNLFSRVVDCSK